MKKFGDMTLADLRTECKKRGAKQDGRKNDLVDRLEAYVKNANFGRKDDQQEKAFSLDVPEPSTYRDINLDTPLPAVTRKLVDGYLLSVDADLKQVSKSLYEETYLQYRQSLP